MMDTSRSLSHPSTEKEAHPMTNDDAGGRAGVQGRRRRRAGQRRRRENALFTCVLAASVAIGGFWALRQGSSLFLTMQAGAPGTARGDRPPAGGKKAEAEVWVALPGASEHQLGLAADINADGIRSAGYEVYDWLEENSCQYGFIRRYPEEKTEITGVENEPWHYRYVGVEAATDMKNTGLCLEEYLEAMEESERET